MDTLLVKGLSLQGDQHAGSLSRAQQNRRFWALLQQAKFLLAMKGQVPE